MTLRRRRNGWERNQGRSLGSVFGAWSATTYCVRWLQDPVCWSYTKVELSACKTRGHIRTFQRYFDSLTRKASRLLFVTTITVNQWILDAAWRASIQGWENIGSQAIMPKKMIFCIHKMEVEKLFWCIGRSTSDAKWDKNQWLELPNWYAASQNEQTLCRRQTRFLAKEHTWCLEVAISRMSLTHC
jgi:hypothetical protein